MIKEFTQELSAFIYQHRYRLQQFLILALGLLAANSVLTDLYHCVAMPPDLRNRIVGARMLKDGLSPYFYEWHIGQPIRYYNYMGFLAPGGIHTSAATATPFVHLLLRPLTNLNQLQFDMAWLLIQYAALAGTALAVQRRLGKSYSLIIAATTILFTYSIGWRHQVFAGQLYIFLSLFAALTYYYATVPAKTLLSICSAALFACMCILTRPAFAIFFVPFIFQYKKYWPYAVAMAGLLAFWSLYAYTNPVQHLNWAEYFRLVALHSQMHIEGVTELEGSVELHQFEGVYSISQDYVQAAKGVIDGVENTSAYIILQRLGIKPTITQLTVAGCLSIALAVMPMLAGRRKKQPLSPERLFVLAFCTFFLFDFFTPVARFTYYFTMWLFPLLLFFALNKNRWLTLLAIIGFALNALIIPGIKMEHSIGHIPLLMALLLFIYQKDTPTSTTPIPEPNSAS